MPLAHRIDACFLRNGWLRVMDNLLRWEDTGAEMELVIYEANDELLVRATHGSDTRTIEIDRVICISPRCPRAGVEHHAVLFALRHNTGIRFGGEFELVEVEQMIEQVERACRFTQAAHEFGLMKP